MSATWVHGNVLFAGYVVEVLNVKTMGRGVAPKYLGWRGKLVIGGCEIVTTEIHTTQAGAEDAVCDACRKLIEAVRNALDDWRQLPSGLYVPTEKPPELPKPEPVPDVEFRGPRPDDNVGVLGCGPVDKRSS